MNSGDRVRIVTDEDTFEGILMPRPDLLYEEVLVIKLDTGYNVGISKEKVKSSEVVAVYSASEDSVFEVSENPDLPNVAILSLGGTISSKIDYTTGGVKADYDANDFVAMCPELKDVANIRAARIMQIMSEDVDLPSISKIAEELKPWIEDESISGLVVTLGTDCFHYIISALSFMIKTSKPIVFTAAQRSIDRGSSDAFMNLSCAVRAAVSWDGGELVSCMHESSDDKSCLLIRATKVRKMHTSRRDAFRPINILPYARVTYPALEIETEGFCNEYVKRDENSIEVKSSLCEDVALVYVHPGIRGDVIDYYVENGYKGIVLAATALGHVPTSGASDLLPALERAIKAGVVVGVATQTLYGRTHPFVYTNLRKLSVQLNCAFGEDMLPEVAYMKLAWLLGNFDSSEVVIEKFSENLVGEVNPSLDPESFLY